MVIYVKSPKSIKRLSENWGIQINQELLHKLTEYFGPENIKVVEKSIEKLGKMH